MEAGEQDEPAVPAAAAAPPPVSGIRPPPVLQVDDNVNANWKLFRQKWTNYAIITLLNRQPAEYQVALLLHMVGDEALKVFNGFQFNTPVEQRTTAEIIEKFDPFAIGEVNETLERYVFNRRSQSSDERFEQFLADIRMLVKTCNYCNSCVRSIVRDRIVVGIYNEETQTALLKERNLTLDEAIHRKNNPIL